MKRLFRFENYQQGTGGFDEVGEYRSSGSYTIVALAQPTVEKETDKSYKADGKWILKNSVKRYAYDTIQLALQSFIKRKERQIKLLSNQLRNAETALEIAKQIDLNDRSKNSWTKQTLFGQI